MAPIGSKRNATAALVSDPIPAAPQQIGRYTVIDRLGSGGMGDVYRAYDPDLHRTVALKILRTPESSDLPEHTRTSARQLMLIEAQAMAKLSHPNIVPIFDVGVLNDAIFLAMEYIPGKSLRQWIDQGGTDWRRAIRIVCQSGRGLHAVHQAGLVHRDVKPENIMVDDAEIAKILDFGLAGIKDRIDVGLEGKSVAPPRETIRNDTITTAFTRTTKSISGTPGYLAPEQFQGNAANARSDQFSLAVVLFEALYGHRPFSPTGVFQARCTEDLTIEFPRRGPKWIRTILSRALAYNPEDRYPDLSFLLEDIDGRLKSRRSLTMSLIGLTLLSVGGSQAGILLAPEQSRCHSADIKLKGIWNEDQRHKAERAFLASKLNYATDTWNKVSSRLNDYRQEWTDSYQQSCQQIHEKNRTISHSRDQQTDSRMLCLDRQLRQFKLMAQVFATASPEVVEHATTSTLSLSPPEDCSDPDLSEDRYPLPQDLHQRNEILSIQRDIDRAQSMRIAGKIDQAILLARQSINEARQTQYPPILIDTTSILADLLQSRWDFSEAAPLQQDALTLAMSINDSERAARIVGNLLHTQGILQSDLNELSQWIELAKAIIARSSGHPYVLATLHNAIGNIYFNLGKIKLAKVAYMEGLDNRDISVTTKASMLMNLAQCEMGERRIDDARRNLDMALDISRQYFGEMHPRLSHTTALLGTNALLRGQVRESLDYFDQAIALATDTRGEVSTAALPAYYPRSMSQFELGLTAEAVDNAETFLRLQTKLVGKDHPRLCENFGQLAKYHGTMGDFDAARHAVAELKRLVDQHPNNYECEIRLMQSRAYFALRIHDLDTAQGQLEIAASLAKIHPPAENLRRFLMEFPTELLAAQGKMDAAQQAFGEILVEMQQQGAPALVRAYFELRFAKVEHALGNQASAELLIDRAEAALIAATGPDSLRMAEIELLRGRILIDLEKWTDARALLQHAWSRLDEGSSSPLLLAEVEFELARTSIHLSKYRHDASNLAQKARSRLVGRLPKSHPRVSEINDFLAQCCSSP